MASGLPCVLERGGGYEILIEDGVSGFLFDTQHEARSNLARLIADSDLRARIGSNARESITARYEQERARIVEFYTDR
jgi:glycosyltransferase involved in cell wall biosynthesis